jgi:hypothetical protein
MFRNFKMSHYLVAASFDNPKSFARLGSNSRRKNKIQTVHVGAFSAYQEEDV